MLFTDRSASSPSLIPGAVEWALLVIIPWLYYRLLPKPLSGIPHDARSGKRLLGDIPDVRFIVTIEIFAVKLRLTISQVFKYSKQTNEIWSFLRARSFELNSPIFQVFMNGPGGRPWVVLTDFRESQDIQTHRQGEFDRSAFLGDVFGPLIPGNHVWVRRLSSCFDLIFLRRLVPVLKKKRSR